MNTDANSTVIPKIFKVPLKAGGTLDVPQSELSLLDDDSYAEIVLLGLKAFLNRGMDKAVGAVKGLEGPALETAKANAIAKAQANLDALKAGNIKKSAAKSAKVTGVLNTEAMRIARNMIKDGLKAAGKKVTYYPASEITASAKALLSVRPDILDMAKANLAARDEARSAASTAIADIVGSAKTDDKLIKAAEDKKAKAKAEKANQLSAKQAGKPKVHVPKAKPTATTQVTAH